MLLALLLCAAPAFDTFDAPLDPTRWYIGVPSPPARGVLKIPKGGWIVSRNIPDDTLERIEITFRGALVVTFHDATKPLDAPTGDPLGVKPAAAQRVLVVTKAGATLDGEALPWKGTMRGTFRLACERATVSVDEVAVSPRLAAPPAPGYLEARTVMFLTTPPAHEDYTRVSLMLWDAEVCFLLRRGVQSGFVPLAAPVRGAPVLAGLATLGSAKDIVAKAAHHPLAASDWRDERGNLGAKEFEAYLRREYKLFELLQLAQRALNAAIPDRKEAEALVHLAVIRHTANAHAAVGLAETQKATAALAALKKALKGADIRRASPDALRAAAGDAARAILGGTVPAEWPAFTFEPKSRFVTIQQATDLAR